MLRGLSCTDELVLNRKPETMEDVVDAWKREGLAGVR